MQQLVTSGAMERRQPRPAKPMSEIRKIRKPIMEKKRRERINNCLSSLRDMLIDETAVQRQVRSFLVCCFLPVFDGWLLAFVFLLFPHRMSLDISEIRCSQL